MAVTGDVVDLLRRRLPTFVPLVLCSLFSCRAIRRIRPTGTGQGGAEGHEFEAKVAKFLARADQKPWTMRLLLATRAAAVAKRRNCLSFTGFDRPRRPLCGHRNGSGVAVLGVGQRRRWLLGAAPSSSRPPARSPSRPLTRLLGLSLAPRQDDSRHHRAAKLFMISPLDGASSQEAFAVDQLWPRLGKHDRSTTTLLLWLRWVAERVRK